MTTTDPQVLTVIRSALDRANVFNHPVHFDLNEHALLVKKARLAFRSCCTSGSGNSRRARVAGDDLVHLLTEFGEHVDGQTDGNSLS